MICNKWIWYVIKEHQAMPEHLSPKEGTQVSNASSINIQEANA